MYTLKWKIDDVIKKWKFKISKIWDSQILALMIVVIFCNNILDISLNRLGATGLQAEWPLQNPQKCPRLYLWNRLILGSENVTNDFTAQENLKGKFWAKIKIERA